METENFAIACSEKNPGEAAKEISLKIKLIFPKQINHIIVFFTPHYNPSNIVKSINLTLKPQNILGIQSPSLIFEDRVIQKGMVACCINKERVRLKETFLKSGEPQTIESFLRLSFRKPRKEDFCLLSFLAPSINPAAFLNGIRLSLGQVFNFIGGGYAIKQPSPTYQIVNDTIDEGLVAIAMEGLSTQSLCVGGYQPLGKPFTITKASSSRNVIVEINGRPAVNIYKHYFEEKYNEFMRNRLFALYPIGIRREKSIQTVNIIDSLEDGSLLYLGKLREKDQGHLMLLDLEFFLKELKSKLQFWKEKKGVVFIVNTLARKEIMGDAFGDEVRAAKRFLGNNIKIIGLYADYAFFSDKEKGSVDIETNNLILTLWQ